ncbi:MAG: hypothetical protein IJM80_03610 [Firmicutes bacterium]|nr:hypothetical protein [Bacillota bacterium]
MSVLQYNFRSVVLGMETRMVVTIPSIPEFKAFSSAYRPKDGKKGFGFGGVTVADAYPKDIKFPTLYLAHGGSGDCMSYLVNTNVARYANDRLLMTVCVDLEESFACDMVYGKKYFTYLTEEVPALVQCLFPSSDKREDNFIAGFSMGAHAALKAALRCPEKYTAVWAMSGAKDMVKMRKMAAEMGMSSGDTEFWAFGSRVPEDTYGTENDLLFLAEQLGKSGKQQPMIITSCGTKDYGITLCREMHEHLTKCGLENKFIEAEGYVHNFEYADAMLKHAIYEEFPINIPEV